jgi:hypothetical protein
MVSIEIKLILFFGEKGKYFEALYPRFRVCKLDDFVTLVGYLSIDFSYILHHQIITII